MTNIKHLLQQIKNEEIRNSNFLHLTANENQMSNTARMFLGSKISERYYMGGGENDIVDFGHFTALGFRSVEDLINQAKDAAKEMLSAADVNLNVLSGVHAMMSAILSTTEPGDMIMTVPLEYGGHFATKGIIERIGRRHVFLDFNFDILKFDVEKIAIKVKELGVKAIYLDVSYYLNPHNLKEIRDAIGNNIIIIYDASHTMGLIMGRQFQNPLLEGADVICANTHKTLPGPHKGMIAFRDPSLAEKANKIIDSCLYSSPHMTHLIALSTTILELKEYGQEYAKQIISNSRSISQAFANLGYDVRKANTGEYSENHQSHVFIDNKGDRMEMYRNLISNNISTNFEGAELANGRCFIRIGTQEVTRRGMKEGEMKQIAELVNRSIKGEDVLQNVRHLNQSFSSVKYSFDDIVFG
jgi:glycine/serine hydroxymethyltransferase